MIELLAGLAAFVRVFSRAFQQLNVVQSNYLAIPPFSYVMTLIEVWIVTVIVAHASLLLVFSIGTGAWMGTYLAMYLHSRWFGKD